MMDGRMALIAQREIAELHLCVHDIAQSTAAHKTAMITAAAASRSAADIRSSEGDTVAAGWA
jgi:hypothetical protein